MKGTDDGLTLFAVRLNELVSARWPGGSRQENRVLAAAVSETVGRDVSQQHIWRIRTGRIRKVDDDVRRALAEFFQVPVDYFTRALDLDALVDQSLAVAGLRSTEISSRGLQDLERVLQEAAEILRREQK